MPNYHAISHTVHGNKRWLAANSFSFAMRDGLLPLGMGEISKAVLSLPIAFIVNDGRFHPVAVMSLQPNQNLFIAADGRWIHGYIPAASRAYPFRLFNTPDGEKIIAIDEDCGLISADEEGSPFFDEEAQPSPALQEVIRFLRLNEMSLRAAEAASEVLHAHKLIKPWDIEAKGNKVVGLHQIDETMLHQCTAEALLELRNSGALILAYAQLLSMQHLPILGELAKAHAQAEQAAAEAAKKIEANGELNLEFLNQGDSLNFGGFR